MKLTTEVVEEKQKALIVSKEHFDFIEVLKKRLRENSVEPFFSSEAPKNIKSFDYYFLILSKNKKLQIQIHHHHSVKTVNITGNNLTESDLDKILWFSLSKTKENLLKISPASFAMPNHPPADKKSRYFFKKHFTKKKLIYLLVSIFVFFHFIFIPFIAASTLFAYKGYVDLKKKRFTSIESDVFIGSILNRLGERLYSSVRPTYLLFGAALWSDNLIEINKNGLKTLSETKALVDNAKKIQSLVFLKNKTSSEKDNLKLRFKKLHRSLGDINDSLITINQKLDLPIILVKNLKNNLLEASDLLEKSRKLLVYSESILSQPDEKKYLIFFANNMELRPGGGFIGSFAIVKVKDYEIQEIKVHDVYDADGQLTAHVDPPKPIEKYLNIPHWFLRDSNFSPDFLENYEKGLFFLDKELGLTDFSGGLLLTTSAVENILSAFDNLYLPDFKENINSKNFYLKTQFYAEKNFFPGSIQKKTFLSSVIQQVLLNLDGISTEKFFLAVKKSLDEKQIVVYLNDPTAQILFDTSFWSGRVIDPKCLSGGSCVLDYLFPYDANVGANKANFFINRYLYLKTVIDQQGKINHLLSIQYENNSPAEIFPTGVYKNYFQVLLPKNSIIKQVTKDGVLMEEIDQKDDRFKLVGFFFEVPPKRSVEIKISYQLLEEIKDNRKIYQLVFQKQIGANNSDLVLDFNLGRNISLINQNFSPLVKDNQILYNTSLSTDKIFFMELAYYK